MPRSKNRYCGSRYKPFAYSSEQKQRIFTVLLGTSKADLDKALPEMTDVLVRIETGANVYWDMSLKRLTPKDASRRLEKLRESIGVFSNNLDDAMPVIEYAAQDAEAYGGLATVLVNLESTLHQLITLAEAAERKLPAGKGRPKYPSLKDEPWIVEARDGQKQDFSTGSPLEEFMFELAHIWAEHHDGQWPKRSFDPTSVPGKDYYPGRWQDFVLACVSPAEKAVGRTGLQKTGVKEAMRRVGELGDNSRSKI